MPTAPADLISLQWAIIVVLCGVIATISGVAWAKINSYHVQLQAVLAEQITFARTATDVERKERAALMSLVDSLQEDKAKMVGVLNEQREILEHISSRLPNRGGRGG